MDRAIGFLFTRGERWRDTSTARSRAALLRRVAELLVQRTEVIARALTEEEGKTLTESATEVRLAAGVFDYYAGLAQRPWGSLHHAADADFSVRTVVYPLGVVAAVTPFNFPVLVPAFKLAPALLCGNSVVWKPSPLVPVTSRHLLQAIVDAGFPSESISLIVGGTTAVGAAVTSDPRVAAVSFTGSSAVGRAVRRAAAEVGAVVQLEMGGSNIAIVTNPADLDQCVRTLADGAFGGSGQRCTATRRIVVLDRLRDEVVAGLAELADRVVVGPGTVGTTNIGPVATRSAVADVRRYVETVLPEAGATAATSRQPLGDGDGYFVNPLVVRDPRRPGTLAASEIFAPVVTVCAAADLEEALSRGNESPYGLSAALWSTDAREIETFVRHCRAGMLSVNRSTTGLEPDKPFGGVGESGYGPRELGEQVLFFYSTGKTVNIRL